MTVFDILEGLTLALTPFLLGIGLDQIARQSLKQTVARSLRGRHPMTSTMTFLVDLFDRWFGAIFSIRFFIISFIFTTIILLLGMLLAIQFSDFHFYFIDQLLFQRDSPWLGAVFVLLVTTYSVDVLSFAQSRIFLQLMRLSPRPLHFLLITYADLCLSLSIVLLIFPAGLALAFYLYDKSFSLDERVALWVAPPDEVALPEAYIPPEGYDARKYVMWIFGPSEAYLTWRAELAAALGDESALPFSWSYNWSAELEEVVEIEGFIEHLQTEMTNIRVIEDPKLIDLPKLFRSKNLPEGWIKFMTTAGSMPRYDPPQFEDKLGWEKLYTTHRVIIKPYQQVINFREFYNYALETTLNCIRVTVVSSFQAYCLTSPGHFYSAMNRRNGVSNISNITNGAYQAFQDNIPVRDTLLITTPLASAFFTSGIIIICVVVFFLTRIFVLAIDVVWPFRWSFVDRIIDVEQAPFSCVGFSMSFLGLLGLVGGIFGHRSSP